MVEVSITCIESELHDISTPCIDIRDHCTLSDSMLEIIYSDGIPLSIPYMTVKRRAHGRNKPAGARGSVRNVRCENCFRCVPKDKAIKRYKVTPMIEAAAMRDMAEASVFDEYVVPKMYAKLHWCISCACHSRTVKVRSAIDRRNRAPPARFQRRVEKNDDE